MDLNQLLLWMVYFSCFSLLFMGLKQGWSVKGWILVAGVLLGLTVFLQQALPQQAGFISGAVWLAMIVVPQRGAVHINQLTWQHRFRSARRWAQALRLLHPMDSYWTWPNYLRGMELAQLGQLSAAEGVLRPFSQSTSLMGLVARCQIFLYRGQWQEMLDWITQQVPKERVSSSGSLIITYLMALGETQQLNQMILELERFQPRLAALAAKDYWDLSRLVVFAFCGQPEIVTRLLKGPLAKLSDPSQQFWLSTALMVAGEAEVAQPGFDELMASENCFYANTLRRRVFPPIDDLDSHSHHLLKTWADASFVELQDRDRQQGHLLKAPITLVLIAINLALFIAEIAVGGSTNSYALYTLGGLIPQEVVAGAWWRLLAAAFLHFGPLHLSLNMFGLGLLGPFVEKILGSWQFLISYLLTAVGSMLTLTILTVTDVYATPAAVGASGAIMGLVGIEAAIQIRILRQQPSKVAAARLRLIGMLVIVQMLFDVIMPQVSFMGHASGLVIGFGLGWLMKLKYSTTKARTSAWQSMNI